MLVVVVALAFLGKHLSSLAERRSRLPLVRWRHAESAFWRELARARVDGARAALERLRVIATEAETVAHIRADFHAPDRALFFWREVRIREMEDALVQVGREARAEA